MVFEEFKGTGNMELVLDRGLSESKIFPAIDIVKSGTRREDLLLSQDELEVNHLMRKAFHVVKHYDAVEKVIELFLQTKYNDKLVETIKKIKL